jgi:hypothetical protein
MHRYVRSHSPTLQTRQASNTNVKTSGKEPHGAPTTWTAAAHAGQARLQPAAARWTSVAVRALRQVRAALATLTRVVVEPPHLDDVPRARFGLDTRRAAAITSAPITSVAMPVVRPPAPPRATASAPRPAVRSPKVRGPAAAPRRLTQKRPVIPSAVTGSLSPELQAMLLGSRTDPRPSPPPPRPPPLEQELLQTLKALTGRDKSASELIQDIERQLKTLRRLDALRRI